MQPMLILLCARTSLKCNIENEENQTGIINQYEDYVDISKKELGEEFIILH